MEANGPFDERQDGAPEMPKEVEAVETPGKEGGAIETTGQEGGAIETPRQENFGMGVLGAFLGSLVGVIVIIALSRLGIISAISGLVMAFAALKGYEKLSGASSTRGIVVTIAIMVVMTFVADWVDWGIVVAEGLNMDLPKAIQMLPTVMELGAIDMESYFANLVMLYVFVAVGAVAVIGSELGKRRGA